MASACLTFCCVLALAADYFLTLDKSAGMLCLLCNVTWMVVYGCRKIRQDRAGGRART